MAGSGGSSIAGADTRPWRERLAASLLYKVAAGAVLALLVMVGLFLANYSHQNARFYWSAMFPVFGLVCFAHGATSYRGTMEPITPLLARNVLHWIVPIVAVRIVFLELRWGQIDADATALNTMLVLAVTCFLAGVHLDRSFIWVSAILAFATVFGTEIEGYLWALAIVALGAVVVTIYTFRLIRAHSRTA